MTSIYYEVFPVTLVSKQAVFIRHYQEKQLPPWIIPSLSNVHPNDMVVHHLINFFGDAFDPHRTIVHSTSWRYEDERDRLLLFFFNEPAPTEIYTLSLHDALPISRSS